MTPNARGALRPLGRSPSGKRRLICFPHAGGSARYFHRWAKRIPADVEAFAVQYPGREDRLADPPMTDLKHEAALVSAEILELPQRLPLILFGHSMGASFAHEVALALAGVSASVEHLVISARPPADRARVLGLADLSDEELRASIQSLAEGANPLDNDELWLVALPTIRTDAQCLQAYRRPLLPILDAPVTAIGGTLDRDADEATMAEWSSATRGPFQVRMLEGGHFYLDNAADAVISIVLHAPTSRYIHA